MVLRLIEQALGRPAAPEQRQSPQWIVHQSQTGLYSVRFPSDWRVEPDKVDLNILNIYPEDYRGEVTISAYASETPLQLSEVAWPGMFENMVPLSPPADVSGLGWHGLRRELIDTSEKPHRFWVALVALSSYGMVFMTLNSGDKSQTQEQSLMRQVLDTLSMHKPA